MKFVCLEWDVLYVVCYDTAMAGCYWNQCCESTGNCYKWKMRTTFDSSKWFWKREREGERERNKEKGSEINEWMNG